MILQCHQNISIGGNAVAKKLRRNIAEKVDMTPMPSSQYPLRSMMDQWTLDHIISSLWKERLTFVMAKSGQDNKSDS